MAAISVSASLVSAGCEVHEMGVLTYDPKQGMPFIGSMIEAERRTAFIEWDTYTRATKNAERVLNQSTWHQIVPVGKSGVGTAVVLSGPAGWGGASALGCLVSGVSLLKSCQDRQEHEKQACRQVLAVVARMACEKLARLPRYYDQARAESQRLQRENGKLEEIIRGWTAHSFEALTYEGMERARAALLLKLERHDGCGQIKSKYPELEVCRVSLLRFQIRVDDSYQVVANLEKKVAKQLNLIQEECGQPRQLRKMVHRVSALFSDLRDVIQDASWILSDREYYALKGRLLRIQESFASLFEASSLYRLVRGVFLSRSAIEEFCSQESNRNSCHF
ncbi:MAG: hypothetical protein S4CHLAM2_14670 [Chlamydiales bacterium]|nr:hypothetical protein [Chlamydiales bacterium]